MARHALTVAAALLAGASPMAAGTDRPPTDTPVARSEARVLALIGEPRCRVDADCAVVGVGSRACGGPERYLAWSRRVTPAGALQAAVEEHAQLRAAADAKAGIASTCVLIEQPAVRCEKQDGQAWGSCRALPTPPGPRGMSDIR